MSVCRVDKDFCKEQRDCKTKCDRDYSKGKDRDNCYEKCERDYPCGKDRETSRDHSSNSVTVFGSKVPCDRVEAARDIICKEYMDGLPASAAGSFMNDQALLIIDRQRCKAWTKAVKECKEKKIVGVSGGEQSEDEVLSERDKACIQRTKATWEHLKSCDSYNKHKELNEEILKNYLEDLLDQEKDTMTRIMIQHFFNLNYRPSVGKHWWQPLTVHLYLLKKEFDRVQSQLWKKKWDPRTINKQGLHALGLGYCGENIAVIDKFITECIQKYGLPSKPIIVDVHHGSATHADFKLGGIYMKDGRPHYILKKCTNEKLPTGASFICEYFRCTGCELRPVDLQQFKKDYPPHQGDLNATVAEIEESTRMTNAGCCVM